MCESRQVSALVLVIGTALACNNISFVGSHEQESRIPSRRCMREKFEERAECQAKKKAWEEQCSCMDNKQLPPGFIGAQLLPHALPSRPRSSVDKDLLRLPAGF